MTIPDKELLPCPFCGGKAKHMYQELPFTKWKHLIVCTNTTCGAEGSCCASKHDAAEYWNRRVAHPAESVIDDVEKERCAAVNVDHLEHDAFLRAWHAFRHTKIDLTADSDDEMCKCMRNAIVAYVGAVRLRNKHLPMERDSL